MPIKKFQFEIFNMTNITSNTIITIFLIVILIFTIILIKNTNNKQFKQINNSSNYDYNNNRRRINKFKTHIPKFMLQLYENNKFENFTKTQQRPDIVRSLIPKHAEIIPKVDDWTDNHLLIFDLPSFDNDEELIGAELRILTMIEIKSEALNGVERELQISIYDDATKRLNHLEKIHIYHFNNTWLSFNLTKPILDIQQENKFVKIVISVSDFLSYYPSDQFKLSLMPISENYEHDYPILLLSYKSNQILNDNDHNRDLIREKRNLEDDYEEETNNIWDDDSNKRQQLRKLKKNKNSCRRRPLYINFSEIQYDLWIVQPQGYEAYQCQGKCFYPVAEHLNPTKHAIVQTLLHSVSPMKVSRSCCVPTILDSISILYVDNNGVLTYRYAYKDMVVVECGCR